MRVFIWLSATVSFCAMGAEPTPAPASQTENPAVITSPTAAPANTTPAVDQKIPSTATRTTQSSLRASDRLQLDTTVVTGNRELPKVLYIVPWKKADLGDLPAQPFNTLLDEVLTPVDRDVFRREVTYYGAISKGAQPANGGTEGPRDGSEK
jgi:hypothetical protein